MRSRAEPRVHQHCRNPELRGEEHVAGQSDEDDDSDDEICTHDLTRVDPEGGSRSEQTRETFTVEDVLETVGFGRFQWKLSVLSGLSWTGDAMEMTVLSILSPQLHCEWRLASFQVALISMAMFAGTGVGCPVWGYVSDQYGRRVGLLLCVCWTLYYGLLSAFAPVYGWLLVLRGLVGFGTGGTSQAVTLYSEFLPIKTRGSCILLMSVFWAAGAVFEVLLALLVMPTLGWRWLLGLSNLPMAVFVCFSFWLPESPRFDLLTGNSEAAMATLRRIATENGKAMPQGKVSAHKQRNRGQIQELLGPQYWRTTLLLWFIWFALAFSYFGLVLLTTVLFQSGDSCGMIPDPSCNLECHYLTSADYTDVLWTTLAEFPGVLGVLLIVDRIGRKNIMALGLFMFSLLILHLYACADRVTVTIFVFITRAFISGAYQVVYVYTTEVFPTENRALALGTCCTMAKLGSLMTPFVSEVTLRTSLRLTLSIYCGCCLLAGVACLILPIETLGRGLQDSSLNQEAAVQTATATGQ